MNRNKTALLSIAILGVIAIDSVAPLVQKMAGSFPEVDPAMIKLSVTLPSSIGLFLGLLAGQLVRFLSKKSILFIGLALYSIGGIGAGWAKDFQVHLIMRGITGAGMGLVFPVRTSLITDFYKGEERASMLGLSMAVGKLVAIVIPPLSAWIGSTNWRNSFFIYLLGPVVLIFSMIALEIPFRRDKTNGKKRIKSVIPAIVFLFAFLGFLMHVVLFLLVTDLSYIIDTKGNLPSIISAYGLSSVTIGTTIAGFIFSWLYSKVEKWTAALGAITCGIGFILLVIGSSSVLVIIALLLAGFGYGITLSLNTLLANNAVGDADSTAANSIVSVGTSLGITTSPLLFGIVPTIFKNMSRVESNFLLASIIYLAAGMVFILITKFRKKQLVK